MYTPHALSHLTLPKPFLLGYLVVESCVFFVLISLSLFNSHCGRCLCLCVFRRQSLKWGLPARDPSSKMRTVRANGALVVQRRACRLVKPSDSNDGVARLLREDETIVADFQLAQLQRVTHSPTHEKEQKHEEQLREVENEPTKRRREDVSVGARLSSAPSYNPQSPEFFL
jgi:hypothetical protein